MCFSGLHEAVCVATDTGSLRLRGPFAFGRINHQLRAVSSQLVSHRAGVTRAFMSSSAVTEAFQGTERLKAYGSEQIQVIDSWKVVFV